MVKKQISPRSQPPESLHSSIKTDIPQQQSSNFQHQQHHQHQQHPQQRQQQIQSNISDHSKLKIRKKNKCKLGRPSAREKIVTAVLKYNQVDLIKNCFLAYLQEIGYKQGLVFSQTDRAKLQKQQQQACNLPKINWDNQHSWYPQQQHQKLVQTLIHQKLPNIPSHQKLSGYLLDIGDIFPRQITSEIYTFLCRLYLIALKFNEADKQEQSLLIQQFVDNLCRPSGEFLFILGRFSGKFGVGVGDGELRVALRRLCEKIVKYIRQLIKN